jgi:hypothetical protein
MGFLGELEEECLPNLDSESDEEDSEESGYHEVNNLSDLEQFSKILVEAQRVAAEAEVERLKGNQPKNYLKKFVRTKRRHKKIKKDLEKQGYFSFKDWFSKAKGRVIPNDLDSDVEMISVNSENKCVSELDNLESEFTDSDLV